jgi:flagellar hook-associated protein 2
MPSIISTGIGSGLDVAGIVSQLVAAEGQPVETRIGKQEARAQVKLSAFGSLKSALSDFRDTLDVMRDLDKFLVRKSVSGNEDVFIATAGTSAVPASYDVEVLQLAGAQKLASTAFTDADTEVVGTGTLLITLGALSFEVEITSDDNTLEGISKAINSAVGNLDVSATIVNADDGSHLILTSEKTGSSNTITVTQSGGDGGLASIEYDPLNGLNAMTELSAAQDAHLRIDGFDVINETNSISGAVEGVAIDLVNAVPGQSVVLEVRNDKEVVRQTVQDFVDGYNALVDTFKKLTSYDPANNVGGPLLGDSTARSLSYQIRRELSTAVKDIDAAFSTLSQVGIELQLDGKLAINDSVLADTLDEDFNRFGSLFATTDGFAVRLSDLMGQYLDTDGTLETRTAGLKAQIEDIDRQREALNERLSSLQERLFRQFNALDSLLGQLTQTSSFLAQQLGNLPGYTTPGRNK